MNMMHLERLLLGGPLFPISCQAHAMQGEEPLVVN